MIKYLVRWPYLISHISYLKKYPLSHGYGVNGLHIFSKMHYIQRIVKLVVTCGGGSHPKFIWKLIFFKLKIQENSVISNQIRWF